MPAFTAFALESCRAPMPVATDCQTLTLQLAIAPLDAPSGAMEGRASIRVADAHGSGLRAAVVPTQGEVLTITFQLADPQ